MLVSVLSIFSILIANAVFECINILQGEDKTLTVDAMPDILKDALAVSFDQSIGHDFLDDAEERYYYYVGLNVHIVVKKDRIKPEKTHVLLPHLS